MNVNKQKKIATILFAVILLLETIALVVLLLNKKPNPNRIFNNAIESVVELKCETTSSVVYGSAVIFHNEGYIITNAHVITMGLGESHSNNINYSIRFASDENYQKVNLTAYDTKLDLAILKLEGNSLVKIKEIKRGNSLTLKSGDIVYAIGNSMNQGISIAQGNIGLPLVNIIYDEEERTVIMAYLTIASGTSGGALLDAKGFLIGITTFRTKDNKGNIVYGAAYSIPISTVITYFNSIYNEI